MAGTRMFKVGSFEEELAKGMQERLVANQRESEFQYERLDQAADFLNAAAEIFDATGFTKEAEILTQMLERLSGKEPELSVVIEATPDKKKNLETIR
jgi:hypothetical protein